MRANIYPVPDPELPFLGAHLTRGPDGAVLLGPTALIVGARDAYRLGRAPRPPTCARRSPGPAPGGWRGATGAPALTEIRHAASRRALVAAARRLVPELRADDFVAGPAGVRAQALGRDGSLVDDFVVSRTERALYVRNAPSPAATSSLPLARLIADEAEPLLGRPRRPGIDGPNQAHWRRIDAFELQVPWQGEAGSFSLAVAMLAPATAQAATADACDQQLRQPASGQETPF